MLENWNDLAKSCLETNTHSRKGRTCVTGLQNVEKRGRVILLYFCIKILRIPEQESYCTCGRPYPATFRENGPACFAFWEGSANILHTCPTVWIREISFATPVEPGTRLGFREQRPAGQATDCCRVVDAYLDGEFVLRILSGLSSWFSISQRKCQY